MTNKSLPHSGNVLFLILIAVALFAALSYIVTQSSRSGSSQGAKEKEVLNSSQIIQYPLAIRTAVSRMLVSKVKVDQVAFNEPNNFGSVPQRRLVFHPKGGGAVYEVAPSTLMANKVSKNWNFNANFQVPNIGTNGAGGNDLIAFLVGVSAGACKQINEKIGVVLSSCTSGQLVNGIPITGADLTNIHVNMEDTYTFPTGVTEELDGTCTVAFTGQASGCFADVGSSPPNYIFYSVISER